jgi:hypothetical protein
MQFYKGTFEQCKAYDDYVTLNINYQGTTTHWSEVFKIQEEYYVVRHISYPSDMEYVEELPETLE